MPNVALFEGAQAGFIHPALLADPDGDQFLGPAFLFIRDTGHLTEAHLLAVPLIDYLGVIRAQLHAFPMSTALTRTHCWVMLLIITAIEVV